MQASPGDLESEIQGKGDPGPLAGNNPMLVPCFTSSAWGLAQLVRVWHNLQGVWLCVWGVVVVVIIYVRGPHQSHYPPRTDGNQSGRLSGKVAFPQPPAGFLVCPELFSFSFPDFSGL